MTFFCLWRHGRVRLVGGGWGGQNREVWFTVCAFAMLTGILACDGSGSNSEVSGSVDGGADRDGDNDSDDMGNDAGSDDTDGDDTSGAVEAPCPEEQPTEGSPCPSFGLSCSYGDAKLPECRTTWGCRGSRELTWSVSEPDRDCATAETDCPPTRPNVDDDPTLRKVCAYADGICVFGGIATQPCQCESPGWYCSELDDECPELVPNDGTACANEGLECSYIPEYCPSGDESESFSVKCQDGVWSWSRSQCLQ